MAAAKGKKANIFVWIILGLLIIGLAGFGVDGFGGSVRSIGKVGDREIRVQDYFRALQQEIRAAEAEVGQSISFSEVQAFGLDRAVRARLVTTAALENETMQLGISAGDAVVAREIRAMPGFQGFDGSFNREAYRFALQQEGLSEAEFEDQLRLDVARSILQAGVVSGLQGSPMHVDTLMAYIGERRTFSVLRLTQADLDSPIPAPDDADLQRHYDTHIDEFTRPEARRISYAWLTPAMLLDEVRVDETALRELYDQQINEFRRPERRLVERLVFRSADDAQAARARIDAGDSDFPAEVAARGLTLEDTDMGDVTESDLGQAGAAVFAVAEPGIVGPVDTSLGPALFRINAILSAQETSFEEAREALREQLALDGARRMINDLIDDFEDLLAGGASIEDLAAETRMQGGSIDFRPDSRDGIAGYEGFRDAASRVRADDFPEIASLDEGGIFALRLDEIVPATPEPFDDVVVRVIESWEAAELRRRLEARGAEIRAALDAGQSAEDLGLTPDRIEGITRTDFLPGLPRGVIDEVFGMTPRSHRVATVEGRVHVLSLEAVLPAETDTEEARATRQSLAEQARQSLAQDLFSAYATRLQQDAGITLDDAAIEAVHQQFR